MLYNLEFNRFLFEEKYMVRSQEVLVVIHQYVIWPSMED